ncbi:MAG TPA: outer membrane protein assembly factor BamA, partial [Vicinamibacterales bacterium]|nr:outer membrane protein assembly factor BamA [Vicinamibacterales bacterium]
VSACREGGTVAVHSLNFKGVRGVDLARLKSALATRENSKVPVVGWQLPWSKKNYFDRGRFDADLKRIEAFYADRGYPDARVTDFDVQLNSKQDAVDVTLTIDEGQPVRVSAVEFRGFDAIPAQHLDQMKKQSPLTIGEPRDRQEVTAAHELAVNELRDHGYPYARVATEEQDGATGKEATIVFTAEPGPLAHFGDVEIAGNNSVSDRVIQRQLTFKPGDLYRRSVVQDSQRRLYSMELFQFVNVESLNPEQQRPDVNTRVTVAEGKHQRVNFGVGYGTEEKARVDGEYHHVNFLGGARSAGAHARWSSLDRGVRLDFNQPYFFAPHLSMGADGQRWYTFTPAYNSIVTGAKATLTHRNGPRFSWSVSMSSERNSSSITADVLSDPTLYADLIALGLDPTTGKQEGTLSAVGFDLQRTTADNVLNARRGYQLAFHAEEAGRLLPGTFNYYAMSVDARHYIPVSQRLVIANRVQLGAINAAGADPTQVPFAKKYFLGGATSIRGWGRYEVSPLGGSGLPIGGNSMLAFSSEARLSFRGSFGAVAFLDAGNVWSGDGQFELGDLRYAVGPGLRYQTPVGPIRFDLGYQLNPNPDLLVNGAAQARRWRIHFSIGQAF